MQQLTPVTLVGSVVRLEPLTRHHVDGLITAAAHDRSTYDLTTVPETRDAMASYVDELLAAQQRGEVLPFAQVQLIDDQGDATVVGCTRYLFPHWWGGRDQPDEIEIGGTWLAATAQRTGVNTEAKFLLLRHAFDVMGVQRVAIATDARNEQSRRAIERIGATFEGILRHHRPTSADGAPCARHKARDTAMYSIIDTDWPTVEARLADMVARV